MLACHALVVALTLMAAPPAAETPKKTVLVVPLQGGPGVEQNVADLLTDTLCADIQKATGLRILTQKDVTTMLGVERQRQLLACTETSGCLTEIAGALDADAVVHGSLGRLGESWVFNLSRVDGKTGAVTQRYSTRRKAQSAEVFLDDTTAAARHLFLGEGQDEPAHVTSHRFFAALRGTAGFPGVSVADTTFFGAVLVGLRVTPAFSLSAGALLVKSGGAVVRGAWAPWNAEGRLKPVLGLEVPIVLGAAPSVGVALCPGLEFDVTPWLSLGAELPLTWFALAPVGAPPFYVFGAATASFRFL